MFMCVFFSQEAQLIMGVLHRFFQWHRNQTALLPEAVKESHLRYRLLHDSFYALSGNVIRTLNLLHRSSQSVQFIASSSPTNTARQPCFSFLSYSSQSLPICNPLTFKYIQLFNNAFDTLNVDRRPDELRCAFCNLPKYG